MSLHPRLFSTSVSPSVSLPPPRRTTVLPRAPFLRLSPPPGGRPMVPPSPANFYFPASGVLKITLRPCLRPPRPSLPSMDRLGGGGHRGWWGGASLRVKGYIPPTGMCLSKKKKRGRGKSVGEKNTDGTHKRRDEDRASTPQGPMGSFRSFLPFSFPTAFFFPSVVVSTTRRT